MAKKNVFICSLLQATLGCLQVNDFSLAQETAVGLVLKVFLFWIVVRIVVSSASETERIQLYVCKKHLQGFNSEDTRMSYKLNLSWQCVTKL